MAEQLREASEELRYDERRKRLKDRFEKWRVEGVVFFDMKNIRYLTGFSGSDGAFFLGVKREVLLVDGRYTSQAKGQVTSVEVVEYRDKMDGISGLIKEERIESLGFESTALSCYNYGLLKARLSEVRLEPLGKELLRIRALKDEEEIVLIEKAAEIASCAFERVRDLMRPGVEERTFSIELEYQMKLLGAEDLAFPVIVASGPSASRPHARPGERCFSRGDTVVVDFGAVFGGYNCDETRTFLIDGYSGESLRVWSCVYEAQLKGIEAVKPGVPFKEIDKIVRSVIEQYGYGEFFTHGTGHGVGLDVHEFPRIAADAEGELEEGMVLTIEPGVYIPEKMGVRIEDTVLVEKGGAKVLTKTSKKIG
ncbi:MAG: Xaa-Pro peptidase family protein [Syntrophales bacterium]|nr:Xaa-Pro peptidase family protein [Syntrophales bacterium]